MAFGQGLLEGFEFVDRIAERRQRNRIANEEMGLRRAANDRADAAFRTQNEIIAETRARQLGADNAARLFAGAQQKGFDNLSDEELSGLQAAAQFNPAIGEFLQAGQANRQAMNEAAILHGALRPRSLGDAVTGGRVAASDPASMPGGLTREEVQADLPPSLVQDEENFFQRQLPGAQIDAEIRIPEAEFRNTYPGIDPTTLGDAYTPGLPVGIGGTRGQLLGGVRVPGNFMRAADMEGMPMVERQAIIDRQRAMLGDPAAFSSARAENLARLGQARDTVASWNGFITPNDEAGADLRRMAAEDPSGFAREFANDYNTLKTMRPNLLPVVSREMAPVVDQAIQTAYQGVAALPRGENGQFLRNQETIAAVKDLNVLLRLQENMSGQYRDEIAHDIRGGRMPVGNPELAAQVGARAASTPSPALPADPNEARANMTMFGRAAEGVANGSRELTTRQVQAGAYLAKHGYISHEAFQNFLVNGTLSQQDSDLMTVGKDSVVINGQGQLVWAPPSYYERDQDTVAAWADNQQDVVHEMLGTAPPGSSPEVVQYHRNQENLFYNMLDQNADKLFAEYQINTNDLRSLSRQDLSLLLLRFKARQQTQSEYDNQLLVQLGLRPEFNELPEEKAGFTTFDELARSLDIEAPAMPRGTARAQAYQSQLATSENPQDRLDYLTLTLGELEQRIAQSRAAAGAPDPAMVPAE